MTRLDGFLIAVALMLSPASSRPARREQWRADLRDAHELGISRSAITFGALSTVFVSPGPHPSPRPADGSGDAGDGRARTRRMRRTALVAAFLTTVLLAGGALIVWDTTSQREANRLSLGSDTAEWGTVHNQLASEQTGNGIVTGPAVTNPATGEITRIMQDAASRHP